MPIVHAISCRIIFSTRLMVHLSMHHPESGTTVVLDVNAVDESVFWDQLEHQAGNALHFFSKILGLKWTVYANGGKDVEFPIENFSNCSLPFPKNGWGAPHFEGQFGPKADQPFGGLLEDLIELSRFDNHEYRVEKLGTLMSMSQKWNVPSRHVT
jgi:hypothetical protein